MVSVIVPIYNVEKYLPKCVDSILKQTYTDLEIILVNDGSTDNSGAICDACEKEHANIKVIHKKNGGLSDARNHGIEVATGEFLVFVDSDDYIHPDMIKVLHTALVETASDIAVCKFREVQEDEQPEISERTFEPERARVFTGEARLDQLYDNNLLTVVAWNKLYRRGVFEEIRYPVGKIHEDEFVVHRLLYAAEKVVYVEDELYFYLQRQNSIMGAYSPQKVRDGYEALLLRERFFAEKGLEQNRRQCVIHQMLYAVKRYYYVKKQDDQELLKALRGWVDERMDDSGIAELSGEEQRIAFRIFRRSPSMYKWYAKEGKEYSFLRRAVRKIERSIMSGELSR